MSEKTITIPQQLYDALAALQRVDETIPKVIERLVEHYTNATGEMNKLLNVLSDDSKEWKQLERRISQKLSMNDAVIIYQWRTICQKVAESTKKPEQPDEKAPPKP